MIHIQLSKGRFQYEAEWHTILQLLLTTQQNKMLILICCMAQNRVIGLDGKMPWNFPADLFHFKKVTSGNTIVMGRTTFENTGVLPNRSFIVLTKKASSSYTDSRGVMWTSNIGEIEAMSRYKDVFVAGGEQTYTAFLDLAWYMMLTVIHQDVEGDTFFPCFDADKWKAIKAQRGNKHSYVELKRL